VWIAWLHGGHTKDTSSKPSVYDKPGMPEATREDHKNIPPPSSEIVLPMQAYKARLSKTREVGNSNETKYKIVSKTKKWRKK